MAHGTRLKTISLLAALLTAPLGWAAVFTSQDGAFTLDMPSGWVQPQKTDKDSVLTLQKGAAEIDIKTVKTVIIPIELVILDPFPAKSLAAPCIKLGRCREKEKEKEKGKTQKPASRHYVPKAPTTAFFHRQHIEYFH